MAVAALLDLGADEAVLNAALGSIPASGFQTKIGRVSKGGVDCCDFNVILDSEHENHDHDMDYLFGHDHEKSQSEHGESGGHGEGHGHGHGHGGHGGQGGHGEEEEHGEHGEGHGHGHRYGKEHEQAEAHEHGHGHDHEHSHGEEHDHNHEHHHEHRGIAEIREIIDGTQMTEGAKVLAKKIFQVLAEAESKAHKVSIEEVHFHEVGAIDSIVDVIAFAVCFDNLNIGKVYVPSMTEGRGTVRCQHGILPVPVPAVANIVSAYSIPLEFISEHGEFVTPTGAAFVAAVRTHAKLPKSFVIKKTGMGAGKRNYERPSILRAFIIESNADEDGDHVVKLESNLDDSSAEQLGFVSEELMKAGAFDVSFIPCQMKKNRPGTLLNVICDDAHVPVLEELLFRHTTTIGIRRSHYERTVLPRELLQVGTEWGEALVKKVYLPDGEVRVYPEYESVAQIARTKGLPFERVFREIELKGRELIAGGAA